MTDSWTQLPNATHKFSAYAAAVFNDEIIIHGGYESSGWSGSANDKTYGYDPFTNTWNTYATLPIGMYDSTLVRANDTLVYASGDTSNNRFSTWSIQYLAENEYHVNPTSHDGLLTSSIYDLRSSPEGEASLLWLKFAAIEPTGTDIGLQYRTADSMQNIASAPWLPTTVPVNTYIDPGNTSLTDVLENTPFLQYRVKYATATHGVGHRRPWSTCPSALIQPRSRRPRLRPCNRLRRPSARRHAPPRDHPRRHLRSCVAPHRCRREFLIRTRTGCA